MSVLFACSEWRAYQYCQLQVTHCIHGSYLFLYFHCKVSMFSGAFTTANFMCRHSCIVTGPITLGQSNVCDIDFDGICSVGGAQFCTDMTLRYVQTRQQFGKSIGMFQNTEFKLADMATAVHASRLMVR